MKIALTTLLLTVTAVLFGCSGGSSTTPTTTTSPILVTDVLTGTVQVPVNGVLQSAINNFTVGQGGGAVDITLTSAVETLPGGSLLTTVTMGLAIGTASGASCNILSGGSTTAQGGASPQLSGSLSTGSYCVQVSDVTNQVGPVAYAVHISHP